ncbi:UNVERIFIED_CONTAM: hypothetical protein FKN15_007449 [Acipenser sinensis]
MQKDKGGELEPPAVEEPGFEVASEASAPPLSSSVSAFLQDPWTPAAEPRQSSSGRRHHEYFRDRPSPGLQKEVVALLCK